MWQILYIPIEYVRRKYKQCNIMSMALFIFRWFSEWLVLSLLLENRSLTRRDEARTVPLIIGLPWMIIFFQLVGSMECFANSSPQCTNYASSLSPYSHMIKWRVLFQRNLQYQFSKFSLTSDIKFTNVNFWYFLASVWN